jgi:hypothetical protein
MGSPRRFVVAFILAAALLPVRLAVRLPLTAGALAQDDFFGHRHNVGDWGDWGDDHGHDRDDHDHDHDPDPFGHHHHHHHHHHHLHHHRHHHSGGDDGFDGGDR